MPQNQPAKYYFDRVILLLVLVLFLLLSPLLELWANVAVPWYTPYLIWTLIILLTAWLQRYLDKS